MVDETSVVPGTIKGGAIRGGPIKGDISHRATIKDVASGAGVSRSTVSRALSGQGYVAEAVRARVREVAHRLGYVPDATAQHLKRRVSNFIGVLVSDLRNTFYADLAAGAGQRARARGYQMMLIDDHHGATDEIGAVESFIALRVAGVILTPLSAEVGSYLRDQRVPIVEVDRQFGEGACDAVVVDNADQARAVTSRLAERGHRRIALFIDETDWTTGRDRQAGYRAALRQSGLPLDPALVVSSGWDTDAARTAATQLLAGNARPTAVFAANNVLAEGVWRAAKQLGLTIPDELSLVSFDDAPWMSMVAPGVTAIAQDVVTIGETAVDLLLERLAIPSAPARTVIVPARLVERESMSPPNHVEEKSAP